MAPLLMRLRTLPAFAVVVLFGGVMAGLGALSVFPETQARGSTPPPEIRLIGHEWWFEVQYLTPVIGDRESRHASGHGRYAFSTATEIHLPVGRDVAIELESRDVIHTFSVPHLHEEVDLVPGQSKHIRIRADEPGIFDGECGENCGFGHAPMRVLVIAQTPADFDRWRAAQLEEARSPATAEQRRGKQLFESTECSRCHAVRGARADAVDGPDLTHFGSRRRLAGGWLENDTTNLSAWLTHAQSLKPGAHMPDLPEYGEEEVRAMVAYLQALE